MRATAHVMCCPREDILREMTVAGETFGPLEDSGVPLSILVVDDSRFARALLKNAVSSSSDVNICEASNGEEALTVCRQGKVDLMFLDLTMPVMDGYGVLEALQSETAKPSVVVVSADVQPKAQERVRALGAAAFVSKRADADELRQEIQGILERYRDGSLQLCWNAEHFDALQEVINIAMGQAGAALATLLDTFVELTVPHVAMVESNRVVDAVSDMSGAMDEVSAVRQAFYDHLNGEAIVVYSQEGCRELADLMGYDDDGCQGTEEELLLDVGNILVGACMNSIAEQLTAASELSFSAPSILCEKSNLASLFAQHEIPWNYALLLEVAFRLESRSFSSRIFIFMPDETIVHVKEALDRWIEAL